MRYAIAGAAAAVIAAGGLTVALWPSSAPPGQAACKAAMTSAYLATFRDPAAPPAAEPTACRGMPAATVGVFATQIMGGRS